MSWIAGLGLLVLLVVLIRVFSNEKSNAVSSGAYSRAAQRQGGGATIQRGGRVRQADEGFQAWMSADLARMERALLAKTHPVDRHFLFLQVCEQTYRRRGELVMRAKFLSFARAHVAEFPELAPALKRELDGVLPRVPTFQKLATALMTDGEFEESLKGCQIALDLGLKDNTKGGFEGRIARIEKRREKFAKPNAG